MRALRNFLNIVMIYIRAIWSTMMPLYGGSYSRICNVLILSNSLFGMQLQYVNEIANISANVCGTQSHPEVELSLGVGSSCMSICGITLLDSHTKCARSTKAGIGYQNENWSTAVLYGPIAGRCVDTYLSNVLSPELQVALPIFVIRLISNLALPSLGDHITGTINQQFE